MQGAATLSVTGAPSASFTATPAGTTPPVMVTFQDRSIGQIDRWHGKFKDRATADQQNSVHTYTTAGTYNTTLPTGHRWGGSTLQVNAGDPPCTPVPGVISLS